MSVWFDEATGKWRAQVRPKGCKSLSESFETKREASDWETLTKAAVLGAPGKGALDTRKVRVFSVLEWFRDSVSPERTGWRWEHNRLTALMKEPFATLTLDDIDKVAGAISAYCQRRQRQDKVKGQTLRRELNLLSACFSRAAKRRDEYGRAVFPNCPNPVKLVERPQMDEESVTAVWSDEDVNLFCERLGYNPDVGPTGPTSAIPWVLLALLYTGLRPSTLFKTRVEWVDLESSVIRYPAKYAGGINTTKNGQRYNCPLDSRALPVFSKLVEHATARKDEKLMPVSYTSLAATFYKVRERLAQERPHVAELVLYGARHTWTTKNAPLFENTAELMKYAGRKSLKEMLRYLEPDARDQVEKLERRRREVAGVAGAADAPAVTPGGEQALKEQLAQMQALLQQVLAAQAAK